MSLIEKLCTTKEGRMIKDRFTLMDQTALIHRLLLHIRRSRSMSGLHFVQLEVTAIEVEIVNDRYTWFNFELFNDINFRLLTGE